MCQVSLRLPKPMVQTALLRHKRRGPTLDKVAKGTKAAAMRGKDGNCTYAWERHKTACHVETGAHLHHPEVLRFTFMEVGPSDWFVLFIGLITTQFSMSHTPRLHTNFATLMEWQRGRHHGGPRRSARSCVCHPRLAGVREFKLCYKCDYTPTSCCIYTALSAPSSHPWCHHHYIPLARRCPPAPSPVTAFPCFHRCDRFCVNTRPYECTWPTSTLEASTLHHTYAC